MSLHTPSDKHEKHELTIREYRRKLFWKSVMWNLLFGVISCAVLFGIAALITQEVSACMTVIVCLVLIPILLDIAAHLTKETDAQHWMK